MEPYNSPPDLASNDVEVGHDHNNSPALNTMNLSGTSSIINRRQMQYFDWECYLTSTGTMAADFERNFPHVDNSLQGIHFNPCQILALCDKKDNSEFYWPCQIKNIFGDHVLLAPFKADSQEMVWKSLFNDCISLHKVQALQLKPSPSFEKMSTVKILMSNCIEREVERFVSIHEWVSENVWPKAENETHVKETEPFQRISVGQYVDIQEIDVDPREFWICRILKNVGGRLCLEYVAGFDTETGRRKTVWEFYLHEKMHPVGTALNPQNQSKYGWHYQLPKGMTASCDLDQLFQTASENSISSCIFKDRKEMKAHDFETEMRFEMLHPITKTQFYPANIVEILNDFYFVVELDTTTCSSNSCNNESTSSEDRVKDESSQSSDQSQTPPAAHQQCEPTLRFICHRHSAFLFPVGWCAQRRLRLATKQEFDWTTYVKKRGGKMTNQLNFDRDAPINVCTADFHRGQKLEFVYPVTDCKDIIGVATVVRFVRPLVWLRLDSWPEFMLPLAVIADSVGLMPVGWSDAFGHPFLPPVQTAKRDLALIDAVDACLLTTVQHRTCDWPPHSYLPFYFSPKYGCEWCPAIYLNNKCYVGPYICRSRFSEMPRRVGPGPLHLVLKWVLRYVVSSTYRPRDILAEIQPETLHTTGITKEVVEVKAKYKGKRWRGYSEICRKMEHVGEWCRQLCAVLDTCSSVISLQSVSSVALCNYKCTARSCTRINKHTGVLKCLSLMAAKKLDKRLKSRRQQHDVRSGGGSSSKTCRLQQAAPPLMSTQKRLERLRNKKVIVNARPMLTRAGAKFQPVLKRTSRTVRTCSTTTLSNLHLTDANAIPARHAAVPTTLESRMTSQLTQIRDCVAVAANGRTTPSIVELSPHVAPPNDSMSVPLSLSSAALVVPAVDTDPISWTADELYDWLTRCDMCRNVAARLRDELVDGQAFMLLTLADVQNFLGLKLGPALKLCAVVKQLKLFYLTSFADMSSSSIESMMNSDTI